jgi:hypothetical protein
MEVATPATTCHKNTAPERTWTYTSASYSASDDRRMHACAYVAAEFHACLRKVSAVSEWSCVRPPVQYNASWGHYLVTYIMYILRTMHGLYISSCVYVYFICYMRGTFFDRLYRVDVRSEVLLSRRRWSRQRESYMHHAPWSQDSK